MLRKQEAALKKQIQAERSEEGGQRQRTLPRDQVERSIGGGNEGLPQQKRGQVLGDQVHQGGKGRAVIPD